MFTPGGQPDRSFACVPRGGGKGGGSAPPAPPPAYTDPVSGQTFGTTDALNAEISQRTADAKTASDAAAAKATSDAATKESAFQTSRQSAYDTAMQNVMRSFQLQGVDPASYMASDITPALQRQYNSVQDLDPNPTAAFPTNLGDTIVGNVLSGKRTQATNTLNQTFTPNYAENLLPDTAIQGNVNDIVNQQFDPLAQQLQTAQKRGTLGGAGYQAALDALNQKKSAATNQVTSLGQGILSSDRSALNDYIGGARTDASNLTLGQNFDPSTYAGTAAGKAQTDLSGLGGALQNAVGDTKFADINDLINAGGAAQGAQNPSATNPTGTPTTATGGGALSPAYIDPAVAAQQKRGLGNVGAF